MSDLSRLLDDVYGTQGNEPETQPEWASEAALDDVFANWVPGVRDDVEPAVEQPVADVAPEPETDDFDALASFADMAPEPETDDVDPVTAFADSDMFGAAIGLVPPAPVVEEPVVEAPAGVAALAPWQPSDDDLLPARRRGLSLSLRRR